jgi:hypothetical protein
MDIQGTTECNRVWQLPDETKVQVSQRLHGFQITYDTENWEDFSIVVTSGKALIFSMLI